jgi:hypothetical protein
MVAKEQIVFNGYRYNRYPAATKANHRHYYGRTGGYLLHREIWIFHNGAVPDGWHIHHKDGDWNNNDISNLEAVSPVSHAARHGVESYIRNTSPAHLAHLERIRGLAKEWHRSKEGRAWHRQNIKNQTVRGVPYSKAAYFDRACCICGKAFVSNNKNRVYCGNACACTAVRIKRKKAANAAASLQPVSGE